MGGFSDYLELEVLDHLFGAQTYTAPATYYVALFTVAPTDAGGGTEVAGNNYSRVSSANNTTNWNTAASGATSNKVAITFPVASGSWGTVVAFGVFDAASGGNLIVWATLGTAKVVGAGQAAQFAAGQLAITLD